jgi:isoleucyl-tRNA synthetase
MYGGFDVEVKDFESKNVLDKWVMTRLKEVITQVTKSTDNYELDRATRPINDFVDDLSTWFLRRSRDRFKSEDVTDRESAMLTTRKVILELSKVLAPSMPFLAEDMYLKITGGLLRESVHLEDWPENLVGELSEDEKNILASMLYARNFVTMALMRRVELGIKVRQPLAKLSIKHSDAKIPYWDEVVPIIKDEVNVKDIVFDGSIEHSLELDTNITSELKEEGAMRDIVRLIQELRKNKKLNPSNIVKLSVETDDSGKKIFEKFADEIKKVTGLSEVIFEVLNVENVDLPDLKLKIDIK